MLCVRYQSAFPTEANAFFERAGLRSPSAFNEDAKNYESSNVEEAIRCYLLGNNFSKASKLALEAIKRMFCKKVNC